MGYLRIRDGYGEPIDVDTGLYLDFANADYPDEKAHIMNRYRLLLCDRSEHASLGEYRDVFVCDDSREYDAMHRVMDACARLAAFAHDYGVSKRKPKPADIESIDGFTQSKGGAFLHINLADSYWYKRFLYQSLDCLYVPGDSVSAPIPNLVLSDSSNCIKDDEASSTYESWREKYNLAKSDSGSFSFRPLPDDSWLVDTELSDDATSDDRAKRIAFIAARDGFGKSQEARNAFLKLGHCDKDTFGALATSISSDYATYGAAAVFWTDDKFVIGATGETLKEVARNMSHFLLLMHSYGTWHLFSFDDGFKMFAPIGISALWADFAQCIAKRPIRICEECGKPVVENRPPRGKPRLYCSDACRKRSSRREKKKALDQKQQEKKRPARPGRGNNGD